MIFPEHGVIRVAAAMIPHGRANVLGNRVDALQQFLDALRLQLRILLERGVQISDVRLMMLPVMDLHRLRVDVRFERIKCVRKRRQCMCH
jgi:hypothetical protein